MQNIAFDPLAMAFKQAADLSEIMQMGFRDNDQWQDYLRMLTAFTYSVGENLASSTFMSGVGKAVNDYQSLKQLGAMQKVVKELYKVCSPQLLFQVLLNKVVRLLILFKVKIVKSLQLSLMNIF